MKKIEIFSVAASSRNSEKSNNWNFGWSSCQVDASIKNRRQSVSHSSRIGHTDSDHPPGKNSNSR